MRLGALFKLAFASLFALPRISVAQGIQGEWTGVAERMPDSGLPVSVRLKILQTGDSVRIALSLPESRLIDEDLWGRVARLPERQREAVVLKYVGDLDHPAIAELLGTTPTMSRRLVSDGLKNLRESTR